MATALPSILDSMKCPICLDFAENAVETVCCAHVYCEKCIDDLKAKNCPSCRQPDLQTCMNRSVRRMIGEIPVQCPNSCGEAITRATLDRHKKSCPQREYQCPITGCDFSGLFQHLADHAAIKHPKDVIDSLTLASGKTVTVGIDNEAKKIFHCPFDECQDWAEMTKLKLMMHLCNFHASDRDDFRVEAKDFRCPLGECNSRGCCANRNGNVKQDRMSRRGLNDHIFEAHARELHNKIFRPMEGPIKILNSEEGKASMGQNGKFYCGREDGADTRGEQRVERMMCKYENGLNCRSCMKLDVTLRNLPYGSLVNGAGHVSHPLYCTHDVKGSEYFARNARSAFCRLMTCGNAPKFACANQAIAGFPPCSYKKPCKDCAQINYVYGIHFERGNGVKEDKDYYGYVWRKVAGFHMADLFA